MSAQADINQRGSEGMGISNPPQGRLRPEDYRPPSRGAKAVVSCASKKKNDERRAKRSAHGGRSERSERWAAPEDM